VYVVCCGGGRIGIERSSGTKNIMDDLH
jgi:hypothetical protein